MCGGASEEQKHASASCGGGSYQALCLLLAGPCKLSTPSPTHTSIHFTLLTRAAVVRPPSARWPACLPVLQLCWAPAGLVPLTRMPSRRRAACCRPQHPDDQGHQHRHSPVHTRTHARKVCQRSGEVGVWAGFQGPEPPVGPAYAAHLTPSHSLTLPRTFGEVGSIMPFSSSTIESMTGFGMRGKMVSK
jgi:hypothetical protein